MIKIQVLGSGMIPRGYGLAPRLEPFYADLTFIVTIMNTPGLKVRYLNPVTMQFADVDRNNLKRVYDKYSNVEYGSTPVQANVQPHVPDKRIVTQNPASVNGMTVPPAPVAPVTYEVLHTDPPQYKPASSVDLNKSMHDFATKQPAADQVKESDPQDHTKDDEKKDDTDPVVVEDKKESTKNDESIKPVNAPNNGKNNGKK